MDQKYIVIIILLIVIVALVYYFFFIDKKEEKIELANPAAVNCIDKGGSLSSVEFKEGIDGLCVFEDNSQCWQWDLQKGLCKKGDLKVEITQESAGEIASKGDTVEVHYTGSLESGTVFDSSVQRGTPFSFTLGENRVIRGWEYGVLGMKVGEKRILTISSNLGYGPAGAGGAIPPNATLIFEVELLRIIK
ncbi:MAG: FKBP-type peptidyl-prolyl cis-trans isomerase [Candidatus Nealsonbacteria bacterium]